MGRLNPLAIIAELAGRSTKAKLAVSGTSWGTFWVLIAACVQAYTGWSSEQVQRVWEIAALSIGGLGALAAALAGLAHTCEDIARKLWVTAPLPAEHLELFEARMQRLQQRLDEAHAWIEKNAPPAAAKKPGDEVA